MPVPALPLWARGIFSCPVTVYRGAIARQFGHRDMKHTKPIHAVLVATASLLLAACAVQQKRVQYETIPPAFAPTKQEYAYGKRVFESLSQDYRIDQDDPRFDPISCMFDHLVEAAGGQPADWRLILFDEPAVADVRAVQGNFVFVWSGIFDVIENESELAGLLASEMAHELADHTDPVEFGAASELLFGITDAAATIGLLMLSQGAINLSGSGMTRWAYIEAADLDPVDRIYDAEQVREMAAIAVSILVASRYSEHQLPAFWRRVASSEQLQQKLGRLSREVSPREWAAVYEERMPPPPAVEPPGRMSADAAGQSATVAGSDS